MASMPASKRWRRRWRRARSISSETACGPEVSWASVSEEIEIFAGSRSASTSSIPITTDVSISPRPPGDSSTGRRILIGVSVDVFDEPLVVDMRRVLECRKEDIPGNELPGFVGAQLTDRPAVSRDDEVVTFVQGPHHLAAVVAQLPLGQLPRHPTQRSTCAPLKFRF